MKNSPASYTHDYQFSRLTTIEDISKISDDGGETWTKEGNFVIPAPDNKSAECYHIFKDSEGNLYRHEHDKADATGFDPQESFDVNGDGVHDEKDLKEDRTCYYIPFGQVLNGLGYGVKPTYELPGLVEKVDGTVLSGEKFKSKNDMVITYKPGEKIYLKDLFTLTADITKLSQSSLYASASPANADSSVKIEYSRDRDNWQNNYIVFTPDSKGVAKIVITDYFYCTPTVITIRVAPALNTDDLGQWN